MMGQASKETVSGAALVRGVTRLFGLTRWQSVDK